MSLNIIIVGCGRMGAEIAHKLFRLGHRVAVVDQDAAAFRNLPADFRGLTMEGDILSLDLLLRAGIEKAEAVAAVTPSDAVNAVIGHVARTVYQVPNIVVRNYEPRKRGMHDAFGLKVISPSGWGADRIAAMLSAEPLLSLHASESGDVHVLQLVVPDAWHGRPLAELVPPGEAATVVIRHGRTLVPEEGEVLEPGDRMILTTTQAVLEAVRRQLRSAGRS